jgi:hypothetical protein
MIMAGLRLQFSLWIILIYPIVESRHVFGHGDEALHMRRGQSDLLHLLRRGHGGTKHSKGKQRREQRAQKSPT